MSHERLEMKLIWGARKEDVDQCALRLRTCLVGFGKIHPFLSKWYEDNASTEGRKFNTATKLDDLKETLRTSMHHSDVDHRPVPRLGLRGSFWSGTGDTRCIATLDVLCGAYARGAANACSLNLFVTEEYADELLDVKRLTEIFRLATECWEPDCGSMGFIDCDEYLARKYPDFGEFKFKCSWFTLIDDAENVSRKKLGFERHEIGDDKILVIAWKDRFAINPRSHAGSIYRLTRRLN